MDIRLYDNEDERFLYESEAIPTKDLPTTILAVVKTHFPDFRVKPEAYRFYLKKGIIQYSLTITKGENEQLVVVNDTSNL